MLRTLLVCAVVAVALAGAPETALAATPAPCNEISGARHNCTFYTPGDGRSAGTPVVASNNAVVGYLHQGTNWVICQYAGRRTTVGPYFNKFWAWTKADNGRWGWVNAVYAKGGGNDGGFRHVPVCSAVQRQAFGVPPTTAAEPGPTPRPRQRTRETGGCARPSVRQSCFGKTVRYIRWEMVKNSRTDVVKRMRALNDPCIGEFCDGNKVAALAFWRDKVKPGGPWDHKPKLQRMWKMRCGGERCSNLDDLYMDVPGTGLRIHYEVFSNLHYGYVGRAAGFPRFIVQGGHNLPGSGRHSKADDAYVDMGMDLYEKYKPSSLSSPRAKAMIVRNLGRIRRVGREQKHNPVLPQRR
jgi:hypothetical protein